MDVQLACPKCKAPLQLGLARMSAGSSAVCTSCGEIVRFQGADANVKINVRIKSKRPGWRSGVRSIRAAAAAALVALIVLCLGWELWLAPLRPGGSLVALKALPLALALPGIFAARRYTYQWSSLLILAYFAEGVTRSVAERGASQACAAAELVLSVVFFAAVVAYARLTRAGA